MSVILAKQKHPELFSMVVWTIWHQRNNIRLGKQVLLPSQILEQAREKLQEFSSFHNPTSPPTATPASCWRPPNHNYVKINFDGALFSKENRAGIGVVIPTKQGWSWLHFHSKYLYPQQYWRWRHLLHEFAVEIGVNRVILEGDSSILIKALQGINHSLAQFGHIAEDVKYIASCLQHRMFSHVLRHCNKVTHALARRVLSYPHMLIWMEDVPPNVFDVFQADLKGLS